MDRPILGRSTCPCELSTINEEEWCWCEVVYANDRAKDKLLLGPFYKHPFEIVPIKKNCFTETVIVNYSDKQLVTVPDWQIRYYSYPYSMGTTYKLKG